MRGEMKKEKGNKWHEGKRRKKNEINNVEEGEKGKGEGKRKWMMWKRKREMNDVRKEGKKKEKEKKWCERRKKKKSREITAMMFHRPN